MIYRHVFVVGAVIDTIRREVRRAGRKETGGPLVGYISQDGALVATHASGPGKNGRLRRTSVFIDGAYAQAFCDVIARESGGSLDYVGDWHRHPALSLQTSALDVTAMQTVAASTSCPIRNPISLIYRSNLEAFTVYVLNDDGNLDSVPASILAGIPISDASIK